MSGILSAYRSANIGKCDTAYYFGDAPSPGGGGAPDLSINVISQDRIDFNWTPAIGKGIQIERSTTAVGPFENAANCPQFNNVVSLFDHQHSRNYWFRSKYTSPQGDSSYSAVEMVTTSTPVAQYFVGPAGNDSNDGLSRGQAFLTLDKAAQEVAAGSAVTVLAGTYNTPSPLIVAWSSEYPIAYLRASGTEANPIVWRADEGAEGSVIIDGNTSDNIGVYVNNQDYNSFFNIEIANVRRAGILNVGSRSVPANLPGMSLYCNVTNCYIHHVDAKENGSNPGGIRADGGFGWTIRNNEIGYIAANLAGGGNYRDANAECVKCYVGANFIIENNEFYEAGGGVHLKDHTETAGGDPYGATIRFNKIHDALRGVYISTGDGSGKAGNLYITHNIGYNFDTQFISFWYLPAGSGVATIHHNISDTPNTALVLAGFSGVSLQGNIVTGEAWRLFDDDGIIDSCDYNIYTTMDIRADWNGPGYQQYTSLTAWRAVIASTHNTVNLSNPGANSATSTVGNLFTNAAANDYSYAGGSDAIGFMADGSNAGPYQYGGEVVGARNPWW